MQSCGVVRPDQRHQAQSAGLAARTDISADIEAELESKHSGRLARYFGTRTHERNLTSRTVVKAIEHSVGQQCTQRVSNLFRICK